MKREVDTSHVVALFRDMVMPKKCHNLCRNRIMWNTLSSIMFKSCEIVVTRWSCIVDRSCRTIMVNSPELYALRTKRRNPKHCIHEAAHRTQRPTDAAETTTDGRVLVLRARKGRFHAINSAAPAAIILEDATTSSLAINIDSCPM